MLWNPKHDPKVDLSKPSLRGLAYLLRHQELWPSGFKWDFVNCDRCAMGLAFTLWNLGEHPCAYAMAEQFRLSEATSRELFLGWPSTPRSITPEEIADRIETYTEWALLSTWAKS